MTRDFSERTAATWAYTLLTLWLASVVAGLFDVQWYRLAAVAGVAAGLWQGRLMEAKAAAKGEGLRLSA
jgi:hypothetical protein